MSDDEGDAELLALLRASLNSHTAASPSLSTGVLSSAEYITDNAISVAISASGTKEAASQIHVLMQERKYSTAAWSAHDLHPKPEGGEETLNFIFTMDLLNFCFWSDRKDEDEERFAVEYRGKRWRGYWGMVAALRRAMDEEIPITDPHFWQNETELTATLFSHIFRSATPEPMPLLTERLTILREAGQILYLHHDCRFANLVHAAHQSAASLVNLLVATFPSFRDSHPFDHRTVHLHKRAQILVADIWGCFTTDPATGSDYGIFHDIDTAITMFADYRIPQMLHSLGVLRYSPQLEGRIRRREEIGSGEACELEIRGCSVWAIELIRREILRQHPGAKANAILIDMFLYDTLKEREGRGELEGMIPHHRTRSIWY